VPHIRPQPVQGQDDPALLGQPFAEARAVGQPQRDQFLLPLHEMRDGTLSDLDPARQELLADRGHAAGLGVAQRADEGDDIEVAPFTRTG